MKKIFAGVAFAALLASSAAIPQNPLDPVAPAMAQQAEISINVFFDRLADSGRWVRNSRHHYVWVPTNVAADWRPYSHGHWVYTDRYGWYFVSDEPFAWAVYHYGRWAYDPALGWYWVPGTRWAPAWVSWRRGGDTIGWAPLPPEGDGYVVTVEIGNPEPPPGYWVFVPVRRFTAPDLTVVIVPEDEVTVIYRETQPVGPVVVSDGIVVNTVIDLDFIQQNAEDQVQTVEVQEVSDPAQAAESDAPVAFTGEIAVQEDAAPEQAVEAAEVESPTAGQEGVSAPAEEQAPAAEEQTPAAEEQAPAAEEQAPAAEEQVPAAEEQAPAAEEQAPAAEEQAPAAEEQAPAAEEQAPAAEEQAPAAEEQAPAAEEQAPAAEEQAPAAEEQAPAAEEQAPAAEEQAPAAEEEAPAAEEQPSDQPSDEECTEADQQAGRC